MPLELSFSRLKRMNTVLELVRIRKWPVSHQMYSAVVGAACSSHQQCILIWMMLTSLKSADEIFTLETERAAQHVAWVKQI
jgi:hypothetical protein